VTRLLIPAWHYTTAVTVERVWGWSPIEEAILLALLKKPGSSVDVARDLNLPVQVAKAAVMRLMQHGLLELRLVPVPALAVTEPGKAFVYTGMPLPERSEMRRIGISAVYEPFTRSLLPYKDVSFHRHPQKEEGDVLLEISLDWEERFINTTVETYARRFAEGRLRIGETVSATDAETSRAAPGMMVFATSDIRDGSFPPEATEAFRHVLRDAIKGRLPRMRPKGSQGRIAAESATIETTFSPDQIVAGGKGHLDRFVDLVDAARSDVVVLSTFVAAQDDPMGQSNKERVWQALERAVARGVTCHLFHGAPPEDEAKHAKALESLRVRLLKYADRQACVSVHFGTRDTHAKFLVADDGRGGAAVVIGSCNWLQAPYYSFELSLELRDSAAAACGLSLLADTLAAQPGATRTVNVLKGLAGHIGRRRSSSFALGACKAHEVGATLRVLGAHQHLYVLRTATREAKARIVCGSNRLGAPMEPAVFDPLREADDRIPDRRASVLIFRIVDAIGHQRNL
jgi:predicted transcriptional regulator